MQDTQSNSWVGKIYWRRDRLPTPVFLGFPYGSAVKEFTCNAGDLGSIPGLGRSPGEGKGCPFPYSGLENPMDCIVHGVTKSRTWLSDFHFHYIYNKRTSPLCIWISTSYGPSLGEMRKQSPKSSLCCAKFRWKTLVEKGLRIHWYTHNLKFYIFFSIRHL